MGPDAADAGDLVEALARELRLDLDNLATACRRAVARGDGEVACATVLGVSNVLMLLGGPVQACLPLLAAVAELGGHSVRRRARLAYQRSLALKQLGRAEEARLHQELALRWAVEAGDRRLEILAHRVGTFLLVLQGRHREALPLAEENLRLAEACGDPGEVAHAQISLADVTSELGDGARALALIERALAFARHHGDDLLESGALASRSHLLHGMGRRQEARADLEAAIALDRLARRRHQEMTALLNLGVLLNGQGEAEEARARYEQALAGARAIGLLKVEVVALNNLASLAYSRGDDDDARDRAQQALDAARRIGNALHEARAQLHLARVLVRAGAFDAAEEPLREAGRLASGLGNARFEATVASAVGRMQVDAGRLVEARVNLVRAEATCRGLGMPELLAHVLCERATLERASGAPLAMHAALDEATTIADQLGLGADANLRRALREAHGAA